MTTFMVHGSLFVHRDIWSTAEVKAERNNADIENLFISSVVWSKQEEEKTSCQIWNDGNAFTTIPIRSLVEIRWETPTKKLYCAQKEMSNTEVSISLLHSHFLSNKVHDYVTGRNPKDKVCDIPFFECHYVSCTIISLHLPANFSMRLLYCKDVHYKSRMFPHYLPSCASVGPSIFLNALAVINHVSHSWLCTCTCFTNHFHHFIGPQSPFSIIKRQ